MSSSRVRNFTGTSSFATNMTETGEVSAMPNKLEELVIRTRTITMTPDQLRVQRQSFAYGNTNIENERITREMVAEADRKIAEQSK